MKIMSIFQIKKSKQWEQEKQQAEQEREEKYQQLKLERAQQHQRWLEDAMAKTLLHVETLRTKRSQLISIDEYGVEDHSKWNEHLDYFVERVSLSQSEFRLRKYSKQQLRAYTIACVEGREIQWSNTIPVYLQIVVWTHRKPNLGPSNPEAEVDALLLDLWNEVYHTYMT